MRRGLRTPLIVAGLVGVLALAGLFATRAIQARRADASPPAAAAAEAMLELAPGDIVTVRRAELSRSLDISGGLKAVNSAVLRAKVAAEVTALTVREGDAVTAGQVLVRLDPNEFEWKLRQAQQNAQASQAQLGIARRALANNKALVQQGFISPTALETSVSNEAAALAAVQAAQAAVELARKARADTVLAAPISGQVSLRLVQAGERVAVDARLLEIVDLSRLELEAAVAPEDVVLIQPGARAQVWIDGLAEPLGAHVVRLNPSAQAGTRTLLVYLAVDPHPALRQGLFARGKVELERRSVLAAPASALRTDAAPPYVLAIEGERVVRRPVTQVTMGQADGIEMRGLGDAVPAGTRLVAGSVGSLPENARVKISGP